jgi:hypothetical protein
LGIYYNDVIPWNVIVCLRTVRCLQKIEENARTHNAFPLQALIDELKRKLDFLKTRGEGLIFMVNSMLRKKVLREYAYEESRAIKQILGDKFKIVGVYADYSFFSEAERREISLEAGNILMALWK